MDVSLGTLIGQAGTFLVLVLVTMKFVWPPIVNMIEERQTQIADGLAAAEKGSRALEEAEAEKASILDEARGQAREIIDQANTRASHIVEEARTEAGSEKERILTAAQAEVEQETNRAREELRGQVGALAVAGAERIMLDFYLINAELGADGYKARYTIRPADGQETLASITLTEWAPAFVTGLQSGTYIVTLELLDAEGNVVDGAFNSTEREITVERTESM